jgi:hypothetical protein
MNECVASFVGRLGNEKQYFGLKKKVEFIFFFTPQQN